MYALIRLGKGQYYMSRNESFTCGDEYEKHKGMWLVTFEKSRFLDMSNYVISDVNIFNSPGIRTHYGIYLWDYIFDVLSYNKPIITQE